MRVKRSGVLVYISREVADDYGLLTPTPEDHAQIQGDAIAGDHLPSVDEQTLDEAKLHE